MADDKVILHHSIKDGADAAPAAAEVANDFMAGFNEGVEPETPPATPAAAEPAAAGEPAPAVDGGDPTPAGDGVSPGVDTSQNGVQLAPQPPTIDLSSLPDDVRQLVEANQAEKERLAAQVAQQAKDFEALKGRVAPVQQQLESAQRQLAAARQPQAPQQQPQPRVAATPAQTALLAQFESPRWKEYERLYPEDAALHRETQLTAAAAMDAQVARMESALVGAYDRVGRIEQERHVATKRAEVEELDRAHPDWRQLNESDEFWGWFNTKTGLFGFKDEADMRARFNDKSFVSNVLDLYKATSAPAPVAAAPAAPAGELPVQQPQQQPAATQQPNARLAMAAAPRGTGGGLARGTGGAIAPGDEFMAGFNSDD